MLGIFVEKPPCINCEISYNVDVSIKSESLVDVNVKTLTSDSADLSCSFCKL